MDRRRFLKVTAVTGTTAALSACGNPENHIVRFIPEEERIVTIEDTAELQLQQSHVVRLETRPMNIEGAGAIAHERERGTLTYLLAQPVTRAEVIVGKYLGAALAMGVALGLGFGVAIDHALPLLTGRQGFTFGSTGSTQRAPGRLDTTSSAPARHSPESTASTSPG